VARVSAQRREGTARGAHLDERLKVGRGGGKRRGLLDLLKVPGVDVAVVDAERAVDDVVGVGKAVGERHGDAPELGAELGDPVGEGVELVGGVVAVLDEEARVVLDRPQPVELGDALQRRQHALALLLLLAAGAEVVEVLAELAEDGADGVELGGDEALLATELERLVVVLAGIGRLLVGERRLADDVGGDAAPGLVDEAEVADRLVRRTLGLEERGAAEVGDAGGQALALFCLLPARDERATGLEREDRAGSVSTLIEL
jgi:hypothetical protein